MFYPYSLVLLVLTLFLTACASKPDREKGAQEIFNTKIHADGSKRFELAMLYQVGEKTEGRGEGKSSGTKGGGGRKGQGKGGRGQSESAQEPSDMSSIQRSEGGSDEEKREAIVQLLEDKLFTTGYCRHGYIELDYSQMRDKTEIVGECQESASDEDRKRWD